MRHMFSNGRYANVAATLALAMAVSGTAYAAITITSKNIRNGTIRGVDLANNTITSAKVRERTIRGADIANNTITSAKVRDGALQARDFKAGELPAGAPGPAGLPGANASTNVVVRDAFTDSIAAGEMTSVTVACAAGERAQSGGAYSPTTVFSVVVSAPTTVPPSPETPIGWRVEARNIAGAPNALHTYAICAGP